MEDDDRDFHSETKRILKNEVGKDNYTLVLPLFAPKTYVDHVPGESDIVKTSELDYGWKKHGDGWKKKGFRVFNQKVRTVVLEHDFVPIIVYQILLTKGLFEGVKPAYH